MHWLVLVENEDKAMAFRRALPPDQYNAVVIATNGLHWDKAIRFDDDGLTFIPCLIKKFEGPNRIIMDTASTVTRALLAFDLTTAGEAAAAEYEKRLGIPCARWTAQTLDTQDIRLTLATLESIPQDDLPKHNSGMADSYWIKRIMDIMLSKHLRLWLESHTARTEKITRLMATILKTIHAKEQQVKLQPMHTHWELKLRLAVPNTKSSTEAKPIIAIVTTPTPNQLGRTGYLITREIWKQRIQDANTHSHNPWQPEPGQPWRFNSKEEAAAFQHHIQKYQVFITELPLPATTPFRGPLTLQTALDLAEATGKCSRDDAETVLMELYHAGWITQPHTANPNLSPATFATLVDHAEANKVAIEPTLRRFGEPKQRARASQEAIRPTKWDRGPEKGNTLLKTPLQSWMYGMIYRRVLESQLPLSKPKKTQGLLFGPFKEIGPMPEENRLTAHMNVILAVEWENNPPPTGQCLICERCEVVERKPEKLQLPSENQLLAELEKEGFAKRKTLREMLGHLKTAKLITLETEDDTPKPKLTPAGLSILNLLVSHLGSFLSHNYHLSVANSLQAIENNETSAAEFIKTWWDIIQTYFESDPI